MKITDGILIDKLKDHLSLKYDKDIAIMIGISPQNFSHWRMGKKSLPQRVKITAIDRLGLEWTKDVFLYLLGDDGELIRKLEINRNRRKMRSQSTPAAINTLDKK